VDSVGALVVSSVNVNGIRAAAAKGLAAWPTGTAPSHAERWSDHAPVTVVCGS